VGHLGAYFVEAGEAAEVHLAGIDAHLEGLVRLAFAERGEERGRHREELAGEGETAAELGERVLEAVR
jgi:hypothetical protein